MVPDILEPHGHNGLPVNPPNQTRAFFGRRKGHALRPRQTALLETLLPKLALDLTKSAPADLRSLFAGADDVRLEIGFGGGEHLASEAGRAPSTGFVGSDAFVNGMAKMLALAEERGLANVRLHFGDASELLAWLPDASLARVDLLYPDPWPKRRHWKRRFVQDASVSEIARILRPGGEFRFATDIPDYAAWTLTRLLRSPAFVWTAECADDWRQPWPGFSGTRYEAKAKREGRVPCYLVFRRR
ncbi:MAG: tRNA (guanosine(46)-N7)-methyltransferase TrmB [Alphaproteobacteria bacterium]|nr:tRNA (guanosine(46)-N7)-methyltransferase TrmB [Alphaproteobacteria bacterium]